MLMAGNASYTTSLRPRTVVVSHTLPALGVHVLLASLSMPRCKRGGLGGFTESEDSMIITWGTLSVLHFSEAEDYSLTFAFEDSDSLPTYLP